MEGLIKQRFIKKILEEEARSLNDIQTRAISKQLQFRTGTLLNERTYKVKEVGDLGGVLTVEHPIQLRLLDIKKKNLKKKGRKKDYKLHNSFVFSHLNNIAYKVMYGFTNEVAGNIKKEMTK